jgi:hypothetical protein
LFGLHLVDKKIFSSVLNARRNQVFVDFIIEIGIFFSKFIHSVLNFLWRAQTIASPIAQIFPATALAEM